MFDPNSPLPKYHQLKKYLQRKIRQGELTPGQQIDTENYLAKQFNLSRQTVRQALGDLEKDGWIIRQQGRGTFVADRAAKKSGQIALVIKSVSNFIFPEIIRGIDSVLSEAGFELKLYLSQDDPEREAEYLKKIADNEVDGVIIEPSKNAGPCVNYRYYQELDQKEIPYLMIHSYWPELDPAYYIVDDCWGGYIATQYLLQLGHRKIAGIFNIDVKQGLDRLAGYKKALLEYGIEPESWLIGEYQYKTDHDSFPYHFLQHLLGRPEKPTAIFCYNDLDAVRALDAIRSANLKVPDDFSIVGYNDSILATASEVKLTSIKHPKREFGREAARMIINMSGRKIEKPRLIVQPELIIRSSCSKNNL